MGRDSLNISFRSPGLHLPFKRRGRTLHRPPARTDLNFSKSPILAGLGTFKVLTCQLVNRTLWFIRIDVRLFRPRILLSLGMGSLLFGHETPAQYQLTKTYVD